MNIPIILVILIIQGWSEAGAWKNSLLGKVLENIPGVKVVVADYLDGKGRFARFKSHCSVKGYAAFAHLRYMDIQKEYPNVPIMIVGHSLGGIIARWLSFVKVFETKDVILVGTPNYGIVPESFGLAYPLLWVLSSKWLCNVPVFRELLAGSEFLKELNYYGSPKDAKYIIGKKDSMVPEWSSDPHGIAIKVDCDHHLVPFNGRRLEDLTIS